MTTGTVKWFNETKGYGFITPLGAEQDVFVHVSALTASGMDRLVEGQRVSFDLGTDSRTGKTRAIDVRPL